MTITKYKVPAEIEQKIKTAIELKKELERYETEIKDALKKAMIEHDVLSIKNESYTITLATRKKYESTAQIPDEFKKEVLDTTKVANYEKLYGVIPENIKKTETKYITWRSK